VGWEVCGGDPGTGGVVMIKMKYRIKEVMDSRGKSTFYPQHKYILKWRYFYYGEWDTVLKFTDLDQCKDWLQYNPKHIVKYIPMEVI
jgi:hypothetical protein